MCIQRLPRCSAHYVSPPPSYTYTCTYSLHLSRTGARIRMPHQRTSPIPFFTIQRDVTTKLAKKTTFLVHCSSDSSFGSHKWFPASNLSISDVLWPSAGAFAAMAILGRLDQMVASKGLSLTIAPLGAVCAVLFATPSAPGARKGNMFIAQMACAALGVLAFSLFGPGWLARGAALAASIAFMIATDTLHPPAASLPLLFIDGAKFHKLHFWYALFPGAVSCLILCLIQEVVIYSKNNFKF